MPITNDKLKAYDFLSEMLQDQYFPDFLVEKGKQILVRLCEQIELLKEALNKSPRRATPVQYS
jgi:Family of unknown function (DUF5713)